MTDIPASPTPDPTWDQFNQAGTERDAELEKRYQEVESHNALRLNQVARLEDSGLTLVGQVSDNPDAVAPDLTKVVTNGAKLMLRPDRMEELYEQNESQETITREGDPFVIIGEVPPRTQQLIDNLLAGVEATPNQAKSTPAEEVWDGNIAGQPIEIVAVHRDRIIYLPDSETHEPTISYWAYHPDSRKAKPN